MEKKKLQELNLDEMDKVNGGKEDTENREYICNVCGAIFEDFRKLSLHAAKEHPYSPKPQR